MDNAVLITLIIVGGIVIISVTAIAWLWWATARGMGAFNRDRKRLDDVEQEVRMLRDDVNQMKRGVQ